MNRFAVAFIIILLAYGCRKDNYAPLDSYIVAEIVNFDLNCSSCILKFPNDSLTIKQEIGASRDNYYQAINLMKDTFKINQRVLLKLRKTKENELSACITLYPSSDFKTIYVIDFKSIE